jgi:hypothetical protein
MENEMDELNIEATAYTPAMWYDPVRHSLTIKGETYPENAMEAYAPLFKWLDQYLRLGGSQALTVNVELNYFNSSSRKALINLFDLLDTAARSGREIILNWVYDEDDADNLEYGEEFEEDLTYLKFNFVKRPGI